MTYPGQRPEPPSLSPHFLLLQLTRLDQVNTALPVFPETTKTQLEVTEVTGEPITFVSNSNIPLFILAPTPSNATNNQVEEYERDSDESVGVDEAEDFFISKRAQWQSLEEKSRPGQGLTCEELKIVSGIVITNDLNYSICLLRSYY